MFIEEVMPELQLTDRLERHLLRVGDVLIAAKGTRLFAACIGEDLGLAVASSSFMIARIFESWTEKLLPPYLTWYLNQPECLNVIKASSRGSSLPSVPKSVIEKLLIPVPSLKVQQTILAVQNLRDQQKKFELKLQELKDQLIHNQLIIKANNT